MTVIGRQRNAAPIARERRQLRREAAVRERMQRLSTVGAEQLRARPKVGGLAKLNHVVSSGS